MGRGKQVVGGFDALFGTGRGQYSSERFVRLDAPRPTAAQRALVEELIVRSREEQDLSILIEELKACRSVDAEDAPLMAQVIEEVIAVLAVQAEKEWHQVAKAVAGTIGVRSMDKAETLIKRGHGGVIHVWPDGRNSVTEWAEKEKGNKTLCNVTFETSGTKSWRRAMRGHFADPPNTKEHACKKCARLVMLHDNRGLYPEATETRSTRMTKENFLWPESESAYMENLKARLREGLMATICRPSGRLKGAGLRFLTHDAAREAYADIFIAEVQRRPKFILHHTLEHRGHHGSYLARDFNILQASSAYAGKPHFSPYISSGKLEEYFSTWFTADDWEKLVRDFMPRTNDRTNQAKANGDDWQQALLSRLKELAKERGLSSQGDPVILAPGSAEELFYDGEISPDKANTSF